jgi:hypothetical protein
MDVDGSVDGRHRLFIEVGAYARLRSRMVTVLAADDASHIDMRRADTVAACPRGALDRSDAGKVLRVIIEACDVEFFQLLGAERLDADWHVLQIFGFLLCSDHDLFESAGLRRGCGTHHRCSGEDRRDGRGEW